MEISDKVKKNLLDLQYNKYLQYYNTAIIILFTYFIGVFIAFITKQIDISKPGQFLSLSVISISTTVLIILFMLRFKSHQQNILGEIKNLKI
ncbi:hypothetical protein HZC32_00570 [Candidatus Woesearchaeota archaeon]|nr:hypothetical protein [Candidatus Woesearchaeota archaeon]